MLNISLCLMTDMYLFIPNQQGGEGAAVSGEPGSRSPTLVNFMGWNQPCSTDQGYLILYIKSQSVSSSNGLIPRGTNFDVALQSVKILFRVSPICPPPQPSVTHLHPKPRPKHTRPGCSALLRRGPLGHRRGCICKGQCIGRTLIGPLTFPTPPSGNS